MEHNDSVGQSAYLAEMLESAKIVDGYVLGITFDDFWDNQMKRDAVALRLSVIGELARKITRETEIKVPEVPFEKIRGLRNRIAHDYGKIDFRRVWSVTQDDIKPLIDSLNTYVQAEKLRLGISGAKPKQGPRQAL